MKAGWRVARLGEICTFNYGKALPESARKGGGTPVFGSNGIVGFHDSSITSGKTIVIGRKGSFGEVHYSPVPSWPIDTAYFVDEASTEQDMRWLFYRLGCLGLNQMNKAAAVPGLNREDAYRQELLLPPLSEQRRIAVILEKADALRTKRREALAQLDRLAQSIFVEMFGDPDEHIRSGQTSALSEVVAPGKAVTYGIVQAGPEVPDGVPYIKTGDIKNGRILEEGLSHTSQAIASAYARSAVSPGDIVMSIRATVGTTAIVPPTLDGANLTQGTARIAPGSSVHRAYLLSYLRTDAVQRWIQAQVKGATFREITLGRLRELPVFVPKLSQQDKFAARLNAVAGLESSKASSLVAMEGLFSSLQQRAFRGEL